MRKFYRLRELCCRWRRCRSSAQDAQSRRLRPRRTRSPSGTSTPPQAPREVIRRSVDLVTTDVIVRDDKGQFVADLAKNDFDVYEDGVKQDVVTFVLTHGGRVLNDIARAAAAGAGRHPPAAAAPDQRRVGPHLPDLRRRPAPRLPQHRPHPRPVQEDLEGAGPRRRHVRHRLDRARRRSRST